MAKLLTIGQLANHCGVTVRATPHYHGVSLFPEPVLDHYDPVPTSVPVATSFQATPTSCSSHN